LPDCNHRGCETIPRSCRCWQPPCLAGAAPGVEQFFQTPQVSNVRCPQGGHVASVASLPKGVQALVVRSTADPEHPKALLHTSELETITAVHWINEKRIGITVKNLRVEFDGNLDELAVDVDGSNITRLISGNWEHRSNPTGSWSATRC
jgi:hypothetical protein